MSKNNLLKNIPKAKLLSMVPPALRVLVDLDSIKQERVNVALFSADNKYVTTSGEVKKIIAEIETLRPLVVIGRSFTVEAAKMIRAAADYFVYIQDDFWTDQRYQDARQNKS